MTLTLDHLFSILPRLRESDAREVLSGSRYSSLVAWARSRVEAPGVAWAYLVRGTPMLCGGVIEGAVRGIGALWFVGAEGCERHIKHVLRAWRAIVAAGGYRRLEAKCFTGNIAANRFAARVGFQLEGTLRGYGSAGEDVNQYGMVFPETTGGGHGW